MEKLIVSVSREIKIVSSTWGVYVQLEIEKGVQIGFRIDTLYL